MSILCYSEALRLVNEAVNSYDRFKKEGKISDLREALALLLRSYVLLLRGVYLPELDITNLASIALDKELIDRELYANIVTSNLILNGYMSMDLKIVEETVMRMLKELSKHDPYINQQMNLFRY
ncbi:MAG: hypothetical protein QXP80_01910 [Zestosphaera sp.]